ncbi:MAG: response regulator transcription factor [Anaerolineae bacterium]|uniref:response regulator transcription factor n=1 Tax=Promineifilum sp. TaxID=2664178 RepID=UPI001D398001|nr:response regulator transcription factor [Anaerolineales bacterium]MCB8933883.1 response regulator transcription factor [Promineifilum sp.]MCO5181442.1 response regulator transcription factor [Promineifilum sp.]MCW5846356.1 response regulator transcription factor [Anaerolineae bacterium]
MGNSIRVLVVDDHNVVREGLRAVLESREDIEVIGEAGDGDQAIIQARVLQPDVILMDLEMPRKNGISATYEIMAEQPQARILVLSSFSDESKVAELVQAGAKGYLLKDADAHELVNAIRQVNAGQMPLSPLVARRLIDSMTQSPPEPRLVEILTKRELMILPMVVHGMSNKDIGDRLGITLRTVGTHVSHMMQKAEVDNRVQLSMLAVRQGLTSLYKGGE